jgi:GNAT superfamily N-acetyltransferase
VTRCVCEAYLKYIERVGRQPGPMLDNYRDVIAAKEVHVAVHADTVVGVLVLSPVAGYFEIENVAVRPDCQGRGIGRLLLGYAERCATQGGHRLMHLYTHVSMTESRMLYARYGWIEFDRRTVNGYDRVFLCKQPGVQGPAG